MDNIRNINEMLARSFGNLAEANLIKSAPMHDTQLGLSGWRGLGLFLSGSHGGKSDSYAVVGSGGTTVG